VPSIVTDDSIIASTSPAASRTFAINKTMTSSSDEEYDPRSTVDGSECGGSSISSGSSAGWGDATNAVGGMSSSTSSSSPKTSPKEEGGADAAGDGNDDDDDDNDDDDCEMVIEEMDFSNHEDDGNVECRRDDKDVDDDDDADPATRIKAALSALVATAKRRKRRMEREKQRGRGGGGGGGMCGEVEGRQRREEEANAKADDDGGGGGAADNDRREGSADEQRGVDVESVARPSRKRRPIQVIMTWMDTFQDNERIQVRSFYSGIAVSLQAT
jgi:hypothetical protein